MSKHKKPINFENSYIASIRDVNKFSDMFKESVNKFLSNIDMTDEKQKQFKRILDLLKYSDVFISDQGIISDFGVCLLKNIKKLSLNKKNRHEVDNFFKEVNSILNIRNRIYTDMTKYSNSYLFGDIHWAIENLEKEYENVFKGENDKVINDRINRFDRSSVSYIEKISFDVKSILKNSYNSINFQLFSDILSVPIKYNNDYNLNNIFEEILFSWKYGDTKISKINEGYFIDSINDTTLSYTLTENNMRIYRNFYDKLIVIHYSKKDKFNFEEFKLAFELGTIQSVKKFLFMDTQKDINDILLSSDSEKILGEINKNKFLESDLCGVPFFKWVRFLTDLKFINNKNIIDFNTNEEFYLLNWNRFDYLSIEEIAKIKWELSLKFDKSGDLFDAPLICSDDSSSFMAFKWALLEMDPTYIIDTLIFRSKDKEKWFNLRGKNFQEENENILRSKYTELDSKVKSNKGGSREVDIILNGNDSIPEIFELKTFNFSVGIKEYRINLDKMNSSKYWFDSKRNAEYFSNGNGKDKLNFSYDWKKFGKVFISEVVFPKKLKNNWDSFFISSFELHRLVKKFPQNYIGYYNDTDEKIFSNYELPMNSCEGITFQNLKVIDEFEPTKLNAINDSFRLIEEKSDDVGNSSKIIGNNYLMKQHLKISDFLEVISFM